MRDDRIYQMHEMTARRSMLVLQQFEFLNTRQMAIEQVLCSRRAMFGALLNPAWFWRAVDNRQKILLAECKRKLEEAMAPPLIKPVLAGVSNGR